MPGHATGRGRVRSRCGWPWRRQQHRVRPFRAASGGCLDYRMARPRRQDRKTRPDIRSGRHDAQGRAALSRQAGTRASQIYGNEVNERHRHRYEVNNVYVSRLEEAGLVISARTPTENLPEIMELPSHPWFMGVQFHPEFTSTPRDGHPLFSSYIRAAIDYQEGRKEATSKE